MRGARFYVVLIAAVAIPILAGVVAHRLDRDDLKLRVILRSGADSLRRQQAATSPADLIRAYREDNAELQKEFREIDRR